MRRVLIDLMFSPRLRSAPRGDSLVAFLARAVFASVLLRFFLNSFLTKIDGFGLSAGAYIQILPRQMEAAGYDPSQIAFPLQLVVLAGTLAELVLPALVVLGVATRPAALAMMGFVVMMSFTDIFGHGVETQTIGALFDGDPFGTILDQRLMWLFLLSIPAWLGGGSISLDAFIWSRLRGARWAMATGAAAAK
ncbi:MAG: DoxX family protein [Paracoccaceae bacterium]